MGLRRVATPLISVLPTGLRDATYLLLAEVANRKRHIWGVFRARKYHGQHGMAMHLGCGSAIKQGWVNIDLNSPADLTLDVRERLPFPDNTFAIIYSEHFYEHLSYPRDITHLLSECYRVLEPGGIHSFAVPDGEMVLRQYVTQDVPGYAEAHRRWNPAWCKTRMDHVNYCLRQDGEHSWYYDEETMRLLLETVGFVDIQRREFDPGIDQELRRVGSMYMKCTKKTVS
jgi:predicted SAM-dependent methyltransferase